jgi:hypothetical protein
MKNPFQPIYSLTFPFPLYTLPFFLRLALGALIYLSNLSDIFKFIPEFWTKYDKFWNSGHTMEIPYKSGKIRTSGHFRHFRATFSHFRATFSHFRATFSTFLSNTGELLLESICTFNFTKSFSHCGIHHRSSSRNSAANNKRTNKQSRGISVRIIPVFKS